MNPWSSLEIWRKLQKICHMLLLMMDLEFGGNFFVTVFAKLCGIMIWIMDPSQKKELQNQGCTQMESLKLLWVSPAPAPGCSSSSPYYSAFHALLVLHLDHMPAKIEGYRMTHDHPLSMISIPITTRECGFFSHKKKSHCSSWHVWGKLCGIIHYNVQYYVMFIVACVTLPWQFDIR
jgi:hypothetical protein